MATSRTQQSHSKRVEQIAEEAAAKIAADSPLEEDVVVTIEELPPTAKRPTSRTAGTPAEEVFDAPFAPTRYLETLAAVGAANVAYFHGIVDAQLKFAGGLAEAFSSRSQ